MRCCSKDAMAAANHGQVSWLALLLDLLGMTAVTLAERSNRPEPRATILQAGHADAQVGFRVDDEMPALQ